MEPMEADLHRIHNLVQVLKYLIAYVIFTDVFPNVLGWIEFGAIWRKRNQRHVLRDNKLMRLMPSCAIEKHGAVFIRKLSCSVRQKQGHSFCIHPWQNHGYHLSILRTNGHVSIHVLTYDLRTDRWPQRKRSPATPSIADPSEPAFVLEQDPQRCARKKLPSYDSESFREFFLNVSATAGFFFV